MRKLTAALVLLLPAWLALADGAVVQRQGVSVAPTALAPANPLSAGATGATTLGGSLASALTTKSGLVMTPQEVLTIKAGTSDWSVRLQLVSSSGFGALDSATVRLAGLATQAQVVVTLGTPTQLTGTPVTLPAAGSDLSLQVSGTKLSGGSSVLAMQVILVPQGAVQPVVAYNYTLTLT